LSQNVNMILELQRNHIEMSKVLTNEILEKEVEHLSSERYSHYKPNERMLLLDTYLKSAIELAHKKNTKSIL